MFFLLRNRSFIRNLGIYSQDKIHILYSSFKVFHSLATNYITQSQTPNTPHLFTEGPVTLNSFLPLIHDFLLCLQAAELLASWLRESLPSFLCLFSLHPPQFPPLWACPPRRRWHESLSLPRLNMALITCPVIICLIICFFPPAASYWR